MNLTHLVGDMVHKILSVTASDQVWIKIETLTLDVVAKCCAWQIIKQNINKTRTVRLPQKGPA